MTIFNAEENEYYSQRFEGLNLSGQQLDGKEFEACTFLECDLSEATLNRCNFIDCHFIKCNLSVVKINYSKFTDVIFDECKVIGIDWSNASWSNFVVNSPLTFNQCILNDSSFFGLSLQELILQECKAHTVDFREGDFSEANFSHTDFTGSLFNKTNLRAADFCEASNYDIDITRNKIKQAKFSRFEAINLLNSLEIELFD